MRPRIALWILTLFSIQIHAAVNIQSEHSYGVVFKLTGYEDRQYLSASQAAFRIPLSATVPVGFTLATSVFIEDATITKEAIQNKLNVYRQFDDVWNEGFIEGCLLISYKGSQRASLDPEVQAWLESRGITHLFLSDNIQRPSEGVIPIYTFAESPPPGPLLIFPSENKHPEITFHNVYRLYIDDYDAFLFGSIPDLITGAWIPTNLSHTFDDGSSSQLIPVPTRIRLAATGNQPLTGMRFGLKDIFDASGLPTAAGSHAYALTHPIPHTTAPSIQRLLALGAQMVGKTRTSQFAHGAAPWEYMDVPYSWNPRGDEHFTASASSSGSACAVAGYNWLEFAVGSDTRGSVRKPAALVGAYGIRPSHGSVDLTGVVPLSEEMDTAGFFARHPAIFHDVAIQWYAEYLVGTNRPSTRFPSKLFYPTEHFPMKNEAAQRVVEWFINILQRHLSINTVRVNFTEMVVPFFPNGSFPAFQLSSNKLAEYRSWVDVGKPTTEKYIAQYGEPPTFDPIPEKMFARAQSITKDDFAASVALKRAFQKAVADNIFKEDAHSCSDSLFIYDAATGGLPSYRVEEFNHLSGATPFLLTAAGNSDNSETRLSDFFNFLASMGGLPEVTIPLGEVRYYSHLSKKWEYIPVAVELVARKGCDGMLLDLVKRLGELGVVRGVGVGRSMFS
ncbi:amidase signature enzyme [Pholiota conissans]|uniref:Amidase signature enzyme n=1 Tax=Pholiota conissans TaxID=109636 RepID=A0A9P5Z1R7_9AGAR|nr:amidase signature enzyme [Pholiota conissans]